MKVNLKIIKGIEKECTYNQMAKGKVEHGREGYNLIFKDMKENGKMIKRAGKNLQLLFWR